MPDAMLIAKGDSDIRLSPSMANRHGLVAGATGTGKTVTIHTIAESLSGIGVPVFMADVKGDLAGLSQPGGGNARVDERVAQLGLTEWKACAYPVVFWDVFGEQGHPVRTTISEMGPLLLSRLLGLNETQSGVLQLVFKYADDNGMLLLDLKDLRALLQWSAENRAALTTEYGTVSAQSAGAIQRALLGLESNNGDVLFGEPSLKLSDLLQVAPDGRGVINILACNRLMLSPLAYASFLLWLLAELYEQLPEVGDLDKPKLAFFFDEAHLLLDDAPDALQDKVEQVIRLIRSKGVGVYFISQNPIDIPDIVLGQLGNRVQHALRAFTPRDQKAVKSAAETFRTNPDLDIETAITELGVGEALVSFLEESGVPGMVQRAFVIPPCSRIGTITEEERSAAISGSPVAGQYEELVDRASDDEMLKGRAEQASAVAAADEQERRAEAAAEVADKAAVQQAKLDAKQAAERAREDARIQKAAARQTKAAAAEQKRQDDALADAIDDGARAIGKSFGDGLLRGILGSLKR